MNQRICIGLLFSFLLFGQTYDTVLANGRVMDPESGLDAVRYIGIRGKRIEAISSTPLEGRNVVDVRGILVAPGFIDLHSHGQDDENYHFKAHDGVTTALELEIGVSPGCAVVSGSRGESVDQLRRQFRTCSRENGGDARHRRFFAARPRRA